MQPLAFAENGGCKRKDKSCGMVRAHESEGSPERRSHGPASICLEVRQGAAPPSFMTEAAHLRT